MFRHWLRRNAARPSRMRAAAGPRRCRGLPQRHAPGAGRIVHGCCRRCRAAGRAARRGGAAASRARQEFDEPRAMRSQREVLAMLDDARFAPLFDSHARAEVPIVGRFTGNARSRAGRSPRLTATEGADRRLQVGPIRAAPVEDIPDEAIGQLALYRAVLRTLYPNHRVRAALVWTAGPD
jgi:ATP-dependent helicase/nuclease subunit A